ncbi:unnamed protein product [Caenorhabditis sp. 36 PRJEB53466]|nr:unnamed protein product [Caenorhabditis sp. 36 PRJEB53466]
MPGGSVDLSTKVVFAKGKVLLIVVMAVYLVSALAVVGTGLAEHFSFKSKVTSASAEKNVKEAGAAADLIGGVIMFFLFIPALAWIIEGVAISFLFCCKSKCCYGYCAIVTFPFVGVGAFTAISVLTADIPWFFFLGGAWISLIFKYTLYMISAFGVITILNGIVCIVVLCRLSYFDRAGGGGEDSDLYSLDDDEHLEKSDSISEQTLNNLTGVY